MSIAKSAVNWALSHSYFMTAPENSVFSKSIKMITGLFWSIIMAVGLLITAGCRKRKFSTPCAHLLKAAFPSFKIFTMCFRKDHSVRGTSGQKAFKQSLSTGNSEDSIASKIVKMDREFQEVITPASDSSDLYREEYVGKNLYILSGTQHSLVNSLKLKGVALVAAMLSEKHDFVKDRLFVCETLSVLQQKIDEKIRSGISGKFAFVVGALTSPRCEGVPQVVPWQHKISVGLQIDENGIRIINFESDKVHELILQDECDFIRVRNAEHFLSGIRRESVYGCETFALRDAVAFLEDEEFFSKIRRLPEQAHGFAKVVLPPRFMLGTQSIDRICAYIAENPDLSKEMFVHRRKAALQTPQNLFDRILESSIKGLRGKLQNHYTSYRSFKYHNYVLQLLRTESKESLEEMIRPIFHAKEPTPLPSISSA